MNLHYQYLLWSRQEFSYQAIKEKIYITFKKFSCYVNTPPLSNKFLSLFFAITSRSLSDWEQKDRSNQVSIIKGSQPYIRKLQFLLSGWYSELYFHTTWSKTVYSCSCNCSITQNWNPFQSYTFQISTQNSRKSSIDHKNIGRS